MQLKIFIKFIIVLIGLPIYNFGQSYKNLALVEDYIIKETRTNDEIVNEENKVLFYYIYCFDNLKEDILVYSKRSLDDEINFECTNYTLTQETPNKLLLNISNKSDKKSRKLEIAFFNKNMSISIDKNMFYLNKTYFSYLEKELLNKKNISELIDLIDDFLDEDIFKLADLKYFSSKEKYRNKDFRILKAKITTANAQNEDIITKWTINYSYNKEGVLVSVNQKSKDETRYSKTLVNHTGTIFSYKVYRQMDERFSDDKEITFDIAQNKYSDKGTYLQIGLNKEINYETIVDKSINLSSSNLKLNKNEIIEIFQRLNE